MDVSALDRLGLVDLGIQAMVQPENPYILIDTPGKSAKVSQPTLHRLLHFKTSSCLALRLFVFSNSLLLLIIPHPFKGLTLRLNRDIVIGSGNRH
jgi:hypothetical protein